MQLLKMIIEWIKSFFKKFFVKKKYPTFLKKENKEKTNIKKTALNSSINNETLPSYMLISSEDKKKLIDQINDLKKKILNDYLKETIIKNTIDLLDDSILKNKYIDEINIYCNNQDLDKLNIKKVLSNFNVNKEKIDKVIDSVNSQIEVTKKSISNIDKIIKYVEEENVSLGSRDIINEKVLSISIDKEYENTNSILLDKDIINVIKNWDELIIDEVNKEYHIVNYVTISTTIIDKLLDKYNKIEDNYYNHRYNKLYYERELQKIKEQVKYLKTLKNKNNVQKEIEKLRKELYTKSKDKYDILYNNEVFLNIDKKCNELLDKVNQKVIDIKNNENKKDNQKTEEERRHEQYLKNILLRFEDLSKARELILLDQYSSNDLEDIYGYINSIYLNFIKGIDQEFNFERNKYKTELIKLYNDINRLISINNKKQFIFIDHINFRMNDLVDAVTFKKRELDNINAHKQVTNNSTLVDEKLEKIKNKYLEKNNKKLIKKNNKDM